MPGLIPLLLTAFPGDGSSDGDRVSLPAPSRDGAISLEGAIATRRSRRAFDDAPLSMATLSQLLWATQGITDREEGHRSAPSAGATYPLELTVAVGDGGVTGLDAGVYRYSPEPHELSRCLATDVRAALQAGTHDQTWVGTAPVVVVLSAVPDRTTRRYGDRGERRYVQMEAGHAGQNLYLQAEALELATVAVGAFDDDVVAEALSTPDSWQPLYLFPVGHRAES
jgi:SagB-type dehydrogenase family enzyme